MRLVVTWNHAEVTLNTRQWHSVQESIQGVQANYATITSQVRCDLLGEVDQTEAGPTEKRIGLCFFKV